MKRKITIPICRGLRVVSERSRTAPAMTRLVGWMFVFAITLFLVFGTVSTAFAQSGQTGALTWVLDNGTLTISGEGKMPDYNAGTAPWYPYRTSIHTVVMEPGVTTIGDNAFRNCENLTSVAIPNGVTTIGEYAFRYCINLPLITLPGSVTTLKNFPFIYCYILTAIDVESGNGSYVSEDGILFNKSKNTIVCYPAGKTGVSYIIPDGVTDIGNGAFGTCENLTSITIPNSVTTMGNCAFSHCTSLTSITIPDDVTTIGYSAFAGCESLTSIVIPDGVTSIEPLTFSTCENLISISLPNSVTIIGDAAFWGCPSLPSITIPNDVTTIGNSAFSACTSLSSITIPNDVTTIGNSAFLGCTSLTSITIPNSVTTIGNDAFFFCENLISVTLSDNITAIKDRTFDSCKNLTSINIPDGVTKIGEGAFIGCRSLSSINIPNSVITIGESAFAYCGLSSIAIPNSVKSIGSMAFISCINMIAVDVEIENNYYTSEDGVLFNKNKTTLICCPSGKTGSYIIPHSVTNIDDYAFIDCRSLTSVTIPNNVTNIGTGAFANCTILTSIILPKSVKTIKYAAFWYCIGLTSITNLNLTPVAIQSDVFNWVNCTLTVPTSAVSAYQNAKEWKEFNIVGGGILVNPVANSSKYGYTIGDGLYQSGEMADVIAVAHDGNKFLRWTIEGVEVSNEALYSFPVTEDVELVAHFEAEVGIVETDNYPSLRTYPNPATNIITISSASEIQQLQIFDIVGRMVHSQTSASKEVVFDTGVLAKGVYLVRAQLKNGGVQTGKVVVR